MKSGKKQQLWPLQKLQKRSAQFYGQKTFTENGMKSVEIHKRQLA